MMPGKAAALFLVLFTALGTAYAREGVETIPPYVSRLEGTTPRVPLPSEAPDKWLLAHIDVETTGLVPGWHEMIDIGLVMTDLEGNVIDSLFLRIQPQHAERASSGAVAVNAFNPETWKKLGAIPPDQAVDRILAFHKRIAGDKHVLMVTDNCQFDTAFLDHLFRGADHNWQEMYYYYVLDIPSMLWGLGERDLTAAELMKRYDVVNEPHIAELHTGITGAMVNVRMYRAMLRWRREMLERVGK
jgi:DNA polymerase III alpha subunit (gram-positive type)